MCKLINEALFRHLKVKCCIQGIIVAVILHQGWIWGQILRYNIRGSRWPILKPPKAACHGTLIDQVCVQFVSIWWLKITLQDFNSISLKGWRSWWWKRGKLYLSTSICSSGVHDGTCIHKLHFLLWKRIRVDFSFNARNILDCKKDINLFCV